MADVSIHVEVCFATTAAQQTVALLVAQGTTLECAVRLAIPAIDLTLHRVGIFGKLKTLDTVLRERDRIEIYRPLLADPKDSRRRRAGR